VATAATGRRVAARILLRGSPVTIVGCRSTVIATAAITVATVTTPGRFITSVSSIAPIPTSVAAIATTSPSVLTVAPVPPPVTVATSVSITSSVATITSSVTSVSSRAIAAIATTTSLISTASVSVGGGGRGSTTRVRVGGRRGTVVGSGLVRPGVTTTVVSTGRCGKEGKDEEANNQKNIRVCKMRAKAALSRRASDKAAHVFQEVFVQASEGDVAAKIVWALGTGARAVSRACV
jgi:hypothetical protein